MLLTTAFSLPPLPKFSMPSVLPELSKMHESVPLLAAPPRPPRPPSLPLTSTPDEPPKPLLNPVSLYLNLLSTRPVSTKIVTSGILTMISDIFAQIIENTRSPRRMFSIGLAGALLTAPMFHYLYAFLESTFPSTNPRAVALHLLTDQLLAAPIWLLLFLPFTDVLEGKSRSDVLDNLKRNFVPSMGATWTIFPVVQILNFSLVPVKARVLVLNVCDLVYTGVLSWIMHRD